MTVNFRKHLIEGHDQRPDLIGRGVGNANAVILVRRDVVGGGGEPGDRIRNKPLQARGQQEGDPGQTDDHQETDDEEGVGASGLLLEVGANDD